MYKSPDWGKEGRGKELEQSHVYSVYDQIAPCFTEISQKAWPNVRKFLKNQPSGSLIADIGCGSGRYLHINKNIYKLGLDICCPLVESAKKKGYEVLVADNLKLPFRNEMFDAVISVGVVHHFSTVERRIEAVQELARILQKGGQLMIYVWAYEQKHRRFDGQDVLIPWHGGHKHSGAQLQASCSDKDISSVSSVSEDESSTDSLFSGHVLERTASEKFLKDIDQGPDDDVFLDETVQSRRSKSIRTRSNTLPCTLEGFRYSQRENGLKTKGQSFSTLAQECRKIEASLKAMSAVHHKGNFSENGAVETPQTGILRLSKSSERFKMTQKVNKSQNSISENFSDPGIQNRKRGLDNHLHKSFNSDLNINKAVSQNFLPSKSLDVCQNIVPSASFKTCQDSSHTSSQGPEHMLNGAKVFGDTSKAKISHPKLELPLKRENTLFDILKLKIKNFINGKEESKEDEEIIPSHQFKPRCDSELSFPETFAPLGDVEGFAVREFPMSSCPAYRKERSHKVKKYHDANDGLCQNGNENSSCMSVERSHLEEKENVKKKDHSRKVDPIQNGCHNGLEEFDHALDETLAFVPKIRHRVDKHIKHHSLRKCKKSKDLSCKKGHIPEVVDNIAQNAQSNISTREKDVLHSSPVSNGFCDKKISGSQHYNGCDSDVMSNKTVIHKTCKQSNEHYIMSQDNFVKSDGYSKGLFQKQNGAFHVLCNTDNSGKLVERSTKRNDPTRMPPKHSVSNSENSHVTKSFSLSSSELLHATSNDLDICTRQSTSDKTAAELCRYYHVFKEGELASLITSRVKNLQVVSCSLDHGTGQWFSKTSMNLERKREKLEYLFHKLNSRKAISILMDTLSPNAIQQSLAECHESFINRGDYKSMVNVLT